jgi:hypothetical protein
MGLVGQTPDRRGSPWTRSSFEESNSWMTLRQADEGGGRSPGDRPTIKSPTTYLTTLSILSHYREHAPLNLDIVFIQNNGLHG